MTGIDPDRLERRLRWAAEQLGLSPSASPAEVRAAWLKRLPEEDFVPSCELSWALAAMLRRQPESGWETRADEAAFAAEEEQLRGEVEAFAEQFWDVPVGERRRRWEELTDRCPFAPTLRARLRLLESGLAVDPRAPSEDAQVIELANHVRELFILRPGPRARARQDIFRRMEGDREKWKTAARRLRYACPPLASLGADLLNKIETAMPTPKRLPKRPPSPQRAEANTGQGVPRWVLMIIIWVVLGFFRGLACNDRRSSISTERFPIKSFQPEKDKTVPPDIWDRVFKKQQIQDEKLKEELKKNLDKNMKNWESGKNGERRGKPDGKSP
ncbi:MAG TPA: hypothetical protein VH682_12140 [Gemmataceae bacterium]|jgi:hypothetical protein